MTYPSENQINQQKSLIGEFIILFEDINDIIRYIIPIIILPKNMNAQNSKNVLTLLEGLTAEPLRSKFDSLIADNYSSHPELILANRSLSTKTTKLIKIRNSLVHGAYRLGWRDFDLGFDKETFYLKHSKSTKSGFEQRSMIIHLAALKKLNEQIDKVKYCYSLILTSVTLLAKSDAEEIKSAVRSYIDKTNLALKEIGEIELTYLDIKN